MKQLALTLTALFLSTQLWANSQELFLPNLSLNASVEWLQGPIGSANAPSVLSVVLTDTAGVPIPLPEDYLLEFDASMPSMGHGLHSKGEFRADAGFGSYINESIRFNMGGPWLMALRVYDGEGTLLDQVQWNDRI